MTDDNVTGREDRRKAWLFYDGHCSFCISAARRFEPLLTRLNIAIAPLQGSWARKALDVSAGASITEMRLLLPNGETAGGAEAILLIARMTVWGWPLVLLSYFPGIRPLLR